MIIAFYFYALITILFAVFTWSDPDLDEGDRKLYYFFDLIWPVMIAFVILVVLFDAVGNVYLKIIKGFEK